MSATMDSGVRFPHPHLFRLAADMELPAARILQLLEPLLTPSRVQRIREAAASRTYSCVPVLENIYDRGNASAVMRTAEAFGFQAVHMIELGEKFKEANRVTQGADKWLDIVKWKATSACVQDLKSRGYQIVATDLEGARPLGSFDYTRPTAVVFGNEKDGISPEMARLADATMIIPMHGFVQSFNISVAAAITLYHIYHEHTRQLGRNGDLSTAEQEILRASFCLRSSKNPTRLLRRLIGGT